MAGQYTSGASKSDMVKIRRRLQQLSLIVSRTSFQGSFPSEEALIAEKGEPKEGWTYYNTSLGQTLTFHKNAWYQYTVDGTNGALEDYQGEFTVAPINPAVNDAYLDSVDGIVYIWNGIAWEVMSETGTDIDITYFDGNLGAVPSPPTGTGETGGWHLNATADVNWLSQNVESGGWGTPIPAANLGTALLDVDNLAEISPDMGNITGGSITLSGLDGSEEPTATALYQMRMDGGGLQGRWRASGDPTAWGDWKNIVDITGNEVKITFDSYSAGETIPGVGTSIVAGNKTILTSPTEERTVLFDASWYPISEASDTFTLLNFEQSLVDAVAAVDTATAGNFYMRLAVYDASDDSLLGFTGESANVPWTGVFGTHKTFTWTGIDLVDAGAEVGMNIYCIRQVRSSTSSGVIRTNPVANPITTALRIQNVQASSALIKF